MMRSVLDQRSGVEDRRGDESGLPWQIRSIIALGVPAAIALFLVWFVAAKQGEALPRIEQKIDGHIEATKGLADAIKSNSDGQHQHSERIEGYMRLLCVNSAKNTAERNTCLNVR